MNSFMPPPRLLLVLVLLLTTLFTGAGTAIAEPTPTDPTAAPAGDLPEDFPADLKPYVGGTDEFRAGPWFADGPCKDNGGSVAEYINQVLTNEKRLMYWTSNPRITQDDGSEIPEDRMPDVFPAGDANFHIFAHGCANDLKRWATPQFNTWGFTWTNGVTDTASKDAISRIANHDDVPEEAWTDPCGSDVPGIYCRHAFFVNCDQATGRPDQEKCVNWNTQVAKLFAGTGTWLRLNTSVSDRISEAVDAALAANTMWQAGKSAVEAFSWVFGTALPAIANFVDDPSSVIDEWANDTKDGATQLVTTVMNGLTSVGEFDPGAEWFLRWYAMSCGLGIAVMSLMTLLAIWRASSKGTAMKSLAQDLIGYAPSGVLLMMFAPLFAQLLVELANALTAGTAQVMGTDMATMITNLERFLGSLTEESLPGGVVTAIALFALLIAGALGVFFGVLMHMEALPLIGVACGISFGMWVYEPWRPKAMRPVLMFVAIVLSKPLLFLLLGVMTSLINAALTGQNAGQGDLGMLGQLSVIVVAFVLVGLSPWSLLKYAPVLPSRSDATGFGSNGSLTAGVVGAAGAARIFQRGGGGAVVTGGGRASSSQVINSASVGGDGGPKWRTAGGQDGRGPAEHRLATTMGSRTAGSGRSGKVGAVGHSAARLGSSMGTGVKSVARAGAGALPAAAQMSAAALNKAKASADQAPGEAEQ